MEEDKITLRGVIITREALEERYQMQLTDTEWTILKNKLLKSWSEDGEELKKLVFKHIKNNIEDIGYKLILKNDKLAFEKINN